MTNKSISSLTSGASVSSTDLFPDIQTAGAGPVKVTAAQIGDYVLSGSGLTGTLPVARGGTGLTSLTAGYIPYGNGTGAFSNSSTFRFDGVNLGVGAAPTNYGGGYTGFWVQGSTGGVIDLSTAGTRVGTFLNTSTDVTIGSISTVPFIFKTSNVERMRIASDGSVGIGTSSPGYKLDIAAANADMRVNGSNAARLFLTGSASYNWALSTNYYIGGKFVIKNVVNNTDDLVIDMSGNLGLGVTPSAWASPFTKAFDIGSTGAIATTTNSLRFANNAYYGSSGWTYKNTASAAHYDIINNEHSWYNAASGSTGTAISFTQAMTLDASGNLGIGTSSPSSGVRLDVRDNSGFAAMQLAGTGIGTSQWTSDGALNVTIKNVSAGALIFGTNNTERARIDSSGNVGIGATSPSYKLHVRGTSGVVDCGVINTSVTSGDTATIYNNCGTTTFQITSYAQGLVYMTATASSSYTIGNYSSAPVAFITNNIERARIDASGNLLVGTTTSPTTGTQCLTIETGTAPTASPADTITIFSTDLSAGNTMLSLRTEGTPVNANTTAAATHRIAIRVNGTVYYLLANTAA